MKPLNTQAIIRKYMDIFQMEREDAMQMADLTQGVSVCVSGVRLSDMK